MRFVDKITKSKYFQKATETEFIKKKIEEVSNTPLLLTVEVQECRGTLAVNIPPPPTDRIWCVEGARDLSDNCRVPATWSRIIEGAGWEHCGLLLMGPKWQL